MWLVQAIFRTLSISVRCRVTPQSSSPSLLGDTDVPGSAQSGQHSGWDGLSVDMRVEEGRGAALITLRMPHEHMRTVM